MIETTPPAIAGIGIMTAARRALLQRSLVSYIDRTINSRPGLEYTVFDDSKDEAERQASLAVAREARARFHAAIRFAGFHERSQYSNRLRECSGAPKAVLEYALLGPLGYTLGQNRNALLLDSAGSLYFGADDDTVCAPVLPPHPSETDLVACSGSDPCEYWCYTDFAEARAGSRFVNNDFLAAHERLLGHRVQTLGSWTDHGNDVHDAGVVDLGRRLLSPDSEVKITMNGLLGDCAWGAPFGLWQAATGYLAFGKSSLDRLTASENHYREATLSRQILRVATRPALSDLSFSMLTFWGLDNRALLPPNLPSHRGQDVIFGQTLWSCFETAVAGHVPLALVHNPLPQRRFWPGEMRRSAAGIDLCRLVVEAIKLCEWREAAKTPRRRLQILGEHLMGLSELSTKVLAQRITERLHESNRLLTRELNARALATRTLCYADDVCGYLAAMKEAQNGEQYWLPLDLFLPGGAEQAEKRVRDTLVKFGALLSYWPDIVEAAKALRRDGVRLSSSL